MNEQIQETETITEFEHVGLDCKIKFVHGSHYCGYVQTPTTDEMRWQSNYDEKLGVLEPDVDAHGGVTYGPDDEGWVGFDCAHAGDFCFREGNEIESLGQIRDYDEDDEFHTKWTLEDVVEETKHLAEQIAEVAD